MIFFRFLTSILQHDYTPVTLKIRCIYCGS